MSFDVTAVKAKVDELAGLLAAKEAAVTQLSGATAARSDTEANYRQALAALKAKYDADVAALNDEYGWASVQADAAVADARAAVGLATSRVSVVATELMLTLQPLAVSLEMRVSA